MEVIIQSLGFTASPQLESFVRERLNKSEALAHGVVRAEVTFYEGSAGNPENCVCEIRVEMPGNDPFVKKSGSSFEVAVDAATDSLRGILRKTKEKMTDHHRGAGAEVVFTEAE